MEPGLQKLGCLRLDGLAVLDRLGLVEYRDIPFDLPQPLDSGEHAVGREG